MNVPLNGVSDAGPTSIAPAPVFLTVPSPENVSGVVCSPLAAETSTVALDATPTVPHAIGSLSEEVA